MTKCNVVLGKDENGSTFMRITQYRPRNGQWGDRITAANSDGVERRVLTPSGWRLYKRGERFDLNTDVFEVNSFEDVRQVSSTA